MASGYKERGGGSWWEGGGGGEGGGVRLGHNHHFVFNLTPTPQPGGPGYPFDLSGMAIPTSGYATASLALRVTGPLKPTTTPKKCV